MSPRGRFQRFGYPIAIAAVVAATLIGVTLGQRASLADEAMLYALAILVAAHAGRGPGAFAAALSVGAFDFSFVEPRFTLAVADSRFLITFAVMLVVGIAIGGLGSRLRAAEAASRDREHHTAALLAFTRDAAAAADVDGVSAAVASHSRAIGGAATAADAQFLEAVERQASIAIEKLRLAASAREAEVRANSEELRNALLSSVSHDLRTPLASITGMATAMQQLGPEAHPEDHKDGLDTIVHEAARLSRILENLLVVTRVEGGELARREWIPAEELVGTALAQLDEALAGRAVDVAIAPHVLGHVDPILGELLLVNLVENAAKHTPPGTPIALAARRDAAALVLEVADRGPGITPGAEHKVFDRFFRAAMPGTQGLGLGLTVCRGIVSAHGGTIEVSPRPGGGSVFRVRIPDAGPVPAVELG
ncbi:MAG: ATP-binding protein [Kofleriaceae bacterium]